MKHVSRFEVCFDWFIHIMLTLIIIGFGGMVYQVFKGLINLY